MECNTFEQEGLKCCNEYEKPGGIWKSKKPEEKALDEERTRREMEVTASRTLQKQRDAGMACAGGRSKKKG